MNTTPSKTSEPVQIVFPTVSTGKELMVPQAPSTQVNTGLGNELVSRPVIEVQKTLSCSALLVGESRERALADARNLYPKMVGNLMNPASTATFMAFGTAELQGVNRLIDQILSGTEPTKIPEVTALMRQLNKDMRGVQKKYDVSDLKVRAKYENWKGGVGRWIGQAKSLVEMLLDDIRDIEDQLDNVSFQLDGKATQIIRNVSWYDQLYVANETEIGNVIYAIGVMELIRERAVSEAEAIIPGNDQLGDRRGEERARLVEFAGLMDQKISAYKGRLFIAWATSPQVRTMRTLDIGVAEKINETVNVTIPTMKATLAQWRMLAQAVEASALADAANENANAWFKAYAAASQQAVGTLAQSNNTPLLQPETVEAMAASIAAQADAVIQAMQDGIERRQALDTAILKGKAAINAATDRISVEFVQQYVDEATRPVEVARSVN